MRTSRIAPLCLLLTGSISLAQTRPSPRQVIPLDEGWQFTRTDPPTATPADWQAVSLPHDWSIAGPFDKANPTGGAGAFLPSGVSWYRRELNIPPAGAVWLEFDGVMHRSKIFLNDKEIGGRPDGYIPIRCDLASAMLRDQKNILTVRTDTSQQPASRWYSGAGIYRHVNLVVTPSAIHFAPDGVAVRPLVSASGAAEVSVDADIVGGEGKVETEIFSPGGERVATKIEKPELWSLESPKLYHARVSLKDASGAMVDEVTIPFGIRTATFTPDRGFLLNGKPMKIKGAALHHDGGAVGAAVPLGIWERRLTALKELGVNAIRTAHNPPSSEFLDLCDAMGFLVMDELFDCWTVGKNRYDYHLEFRDWSKADIRDTVRRDRNHPSVILWSAGNEIHDTPKAEMAKEILKGLVETFHAEDPTRPVTQALFRPNASHDYEDGLADLLDVVGQNYRENELLAAASQKPTRKILGTETTQSRQAWVAMRDDPRFSGQFLWTGIDYLGESRRWPTISSSFGLLDRTGLVKPVGYERASWWAEKPMVLVVRRVAPTPVMPTDPGYSPDDPLRMGPTLLDDWTPRDLGAHEEAAEVYSNCEEVELFLNGVSLGKQGINADARPRVWKVAFAAGELRAVGRNGGQEVATHVQRTAGAPAAIRVTADQATLRPVFDEVALVRCEVVDAQGVVVPTGAYALEFAVEGSGKLVAVDNGDTRSTEPFSGKSRKTFEGRAVAIVRATGVGEIRVKVNGGGLPGAEVKLRGAP